MKKLKLILIGLLCLFSSIGIFATYSKMSTKEIEVIERNLIEINKEINIKEKKIKMLKTELAQTEDKKNKLISLKDSKICVLANIKKLNNQAIQESSEELCFGKKKS